MTEGTTSEAKPKRLGYLLSATGISVTGDGILLTAAPLLAASLTREPVLVSLVAAGGYAGWLVVGLIAGVLVDRWPLRTVMVITDLLRCAVLITLAILTAVDLISIWALLVAVFLISVGSCFFDPAAQAMMPIVVGRDKKRLTAANGKLWAFDTIGRSLIGPPLGAAAYGIGRSVPFIGDAVSFLLSAALVSRLPKARPASAEHKPIWASVLGGVRFLFTHAELRAITLGMTVYNFGWNIAFATIVLFAQDILGLGNLGYGLLIGVSAFGGVLSGWLSPKVTHRFSTRLVYAVALVTQALGWLMLPVFGNVWLTGVALVLIGIASSAVSAVGGAARQLHTPDGQVGIVVAATRLLGIGSAAVGALAGGFVAEVGGLRAPLITAVVLLSAGSVGFFLRRSPA